MTENLTAKYIKFWFCVMLSALFFNRRHFRSGNDNLLFQSKLSLLYAFQVNSSIGMFIVSKMTENPTAKYEILVSCEPVDYLRVYRNLRRVNRKKKFKRICS